MKMRIGNHRHVTLIAALVAACILVAWASPAGAQIHWKTGIEPSANMTPGEAADRIAGIAYENERQHIVVQFSEPVTPDQQQQLAENGVRLVGYLGNNAFFALVTKEGMTRSGLASIQTFTDAKPIKTEWKLHPMIFDDEIPDYTVVDNKKDTNPTVANYVIFHRDVKLEEEGVELLHRYGANIRSLVYSINAAVVELEKDEVRRLAAEDIVQWIEPPIPQLTDLNNSNREITGANEAQAAPYGLSGAGISVLVFDGGVGLSSHSDFGGRHTTRDDDGLSDHATHVAGTIGGDGAQSGGTYAGMAPAVILESYGAQWPGGFGEGGLYTDPGDIEADFHEAITQYGVDISNASIGTNTAPNGFPCEWEGNYGATGQLIDTIARGDGSNPLFTTPFRLVWANGNERQTSRCGSTYVSTAPPACAKNHITVGALNSNDDSVTSFTSWGPTDDGRIKPDISGPGCQSNDDNDVTSCSSSGGYTGKCGTSMSAPTVCGLSALLLEDYRAHYPELDDPRASTLKAIFAHTAQDVENVGPDYKTGYGSVRIIPAIDLVRAGNFLEDVVNHGDVYEVLVLASAGADKIQVTLAWDDVPGIANSDPVLVNDLDLEVYDTDNTLRFPWTLDPANPELPAVQTAVDRKNNIEQVTIFDPTPGVYRIRVVGFNIPEGPQPFSLTATPQLIACSSAGLASLDKAKYPCGDVAQLRVVDCDLNTDDNLVETVSVTITSNTEPAGEIVLLTETDPATATFVNSIDLSLTDAPGVLQISAGDTVTMTYIDADDGEGGINVTVTDTAEIDCTSPVISDVSAVDIGPFEAKIHFFTNELAAGTVHYGTNCGNLDSSVDAGYQTEHFLPIDGLDENTQYFYSLEAVDEAGNLATDDNGGACYTFVTTDIPLYFTEEFVNDDNDLAGQVLFFSPNGMIDFYAVCVEQAILLPTDPVGGTSISLGDDDYEQIDVSGGQSVWLYGQSYTSVYVGSNGYLTFTDGDNDHTETLNDHFDTPRISMLFEDLNPSLGGMVSYKQTADRLAITYDEVREYNSPNVNTFQVELFFNGDIRMTYLDVQTDNGIVGISEGNGLPPEYVEVDLTNLGNCGPQPPLANAVNLDVPAGTPQVDVVLNAVDDGLPDPPASLFYTILSLPAYGNLLEPGVGQITSVPHVLSNEGDTVIYDVPNGFIGEDSFTYRANDYGAPPEGGDSNIGFVTIQVGGPSAVYTWNMDTNPGWSMEGQWAWGVPTGGGTHNFDPTGGYTGDHVVGYNLEGDYVSEMPVYAATTTPIDCTDLTGTELKFWRWLGVESANYDHATIEASTDGSTWTVIWDHTGVAISESIWTPHAFDLSDIADGQGNLQIRWLMGPTDGTVTYPGWNIDDVEIWGVVPFLLCPFDLDGNGAVGPGDVGIVKNSFGCDLSEPACAALDFDNNGAVGPGDVGAVKNEFGPCD